MLSSLLDSARSRSFVGLYRSIQGIAGVKRLVACGHQPSKIALTYDDGPHPEITPQLLRLLETHNARGTFFCVGQEAVKEPGLVREMHAAGHEIGSHTYSHRSLRQKPFQEALEDFRRGRETIEDLLGVPCPLFRPAHGQLTVRSASAIWKAGCTIVMWSFSTRDYGQHDKEYLRQRIVRRGLIAGDIVLLHDTATMSVELTKLIIEAASSSMVALPVSRLFSNIVSSDKPPC